MAIANSQPGYEIVQLTYHDESKIEVDIFAKPGRILFYGHNLFNLPERMGHSPRYITMLRHPFDRLLSDYFWLNLPGRMPCEVFEEFCRFVNAAPHLEFYIYHCGLLNYKNSQHFNLSDYDGIDEALSQEEAINNLDNRFQLVGITELFEESLFILAHKIGLTTIAPWWLTRHPKSLYRPTFFDLPITIRRTIENKCQKDLQLYESYREKLEHEAYSYDFNGDFFKYKNSALIS